MATDDGFIRLDDTAVGGFHAIDPSSFIPQLLAGIAPVWNRDIFLFVIADADRHTGDPAVDKNVLLSFKVVHHCGDDGLDKRILQERSTNLFGFGKYISCRKSGQLRNSVHRAIEIVVALKVTVTVPVV